ncbi:hypothetical protein Mgra_00008058 [Meloidogyne graminicola]|uniref:26S proteasome complex subunit dss-1 n=1 Tax=Meloidogyne graminicola TaxID=189291 RepID=A0A8S9ZGU0_9BILA|nr:hypothetical protein Mgra_00008058 [Meloidogyne graminicola]
MLESKKIFFFKINFKMDVDPKEGGEQNKEVTTTTSTTQSSELIASSKPKDEEEEFEEFPIYKESEDGGASTNGESNASTVQTTSNVWEDNWDDEDVETEFHKQLEEELKKRGLKLP